MTALSDLLPILETIVSFIDEGVVITTEGGELIYHNPAAYEFLGLSPEQPIESLNRFGPINLQKSILRASIDAGEADAAGRPSGNFVSFVEKVSEGDDYRHLEFQSGLVTLQDNKTRLRLVLIADRTERARLSAVLESQSAQNMITKDPQMLGLIRRIEQVAPTNAFVLLQGESGTGKTQMARRLHQLSERREHPFVEVNCAAIPESLVEAELFGYVKGAFTGASQDRAGRFLSAHNGTLFLDEISEIPIHLQAKLLRAIQDQSFEPVGSDDTTQVDVRIIAASNKNLRDMVDEEKFRADLYYRIAVIPLTIPSLRERPGDIAHLSKHFLQQLFERGYPEDTQFKQDALRMMMDYSWPGNVRELENAVEHGVICAINGWVETESLPLDLRRFSKDASRSSGGSPTPQVDEKGSIVAALDEANGNRALAAKNLGIDRSTLWRKMNKYNIE